MKHVGRSLPRLEDRAFLTGKAPFLGDQGYRGELTMRVVRSPAAFGKLNGIDVAGALGTPGVVAVWTAADVDTLPPLPFRIMGADNLAPYRQPLLAKEMVRYVGEPVAVIFAQTPLAAEDALDRVAVNLEVFEPALDHEGPAVGLTGDVRAVEATVIRKAYGDLNAAFHHAEFVVERRFSLARDGAVPAELRSGLAWWDAARDVLHYTGAAKAPHQFRDTLAGMLARSPGSVEVVVPPIGGSFGMRGEIEAEDVLACHAALTLGRPVRWVEDRREQFVAASQGRGASAKLRAAIDENGRVLALDAMVMVDQGAYLRPTGLAMPDMLLAALPGPYGFAAYRGAAHMRMTNATPCALLRGAGRVEATFFRERMMDAIADELGIDPGELRRKNLITVKAPTDRQLTSLGRPVIVDTGRYRDLLDEAEKHFAIDLMRRRAQERRLRGALVGVGVTITVDRSGDAPGDRVTLSVDRSGTVELVTGAVDFGQGLRTALAQIVADVMGVEMTRVRVVHGATARLPGGAGSHASQTTALTGTATLYAAEALRDKVIEVAAAMLQVPADRLTIHTGRVREADRHFGAAVELGAVAAAMETGGTHATDDGLGAFAEGMVKDADVSAPYGVHAALVEIDPMTGIVTVERAMTAYEVGNAVNPALVEAQLAAGMVQGVSSALYTALGTDEDGTPRVTRLADYAMPTVGDIAHLDVLISENAPAPGNPLGFKGVGEGGVTGIGAAVAAAIDDALGAAGFVTRLPVRPSDIRAHLREYGMPAQLDAGAPVAPSQRRSLDRSGTKMTTKASAVS